MRILAAIGTLLLPLAVAVLALPASAGEVVKGDIRITQPWARATPGGAKVTAGYVTLTNTGKTADRLISASVEIAAVLELHDMTMIDGVMRMRRMEKGIEIKPGETVVLKPGGMHLMLLELRKSVVQGSPVKGTLMFERAGSVDVEFEVAPIGAAGPGAQTGSAADRASGHKNH